MMSGKSVEYEKLCKNMNHQKVWGEDMTSSKGRTMLCFGEGVCKEDYVGKL